MKTTTKAAEEKMRRQRNMTVVVEVEYGIDFVVAAEIVVDFVVEKEDVLKELKATSPETGGSASPHSHWH